MHTVVAFEVVSMLIMVCRAVSCFFEQYNSTATQACAMLALYQSTIWGQSRLSNVESEGAYGILQTQWPAGSALFLLCFIADQCMRRQIVSTDKVLDTLRTQYNSILNGEEINENKKIS